MRKGWNITFTTIVERTGNNHSFTFYEFGDLVDVVRLVLAFKKKGHKLIKIDLERVELLV